MRIPVTIFSGYLGAGKTTLINRLLREDHGQNITVIVNDFGSVNIDADLIAQEKADTVALTNGCVCCSLGDDLAVQLTTIALRADRPDHIVIEASGVSDPAAIAQTAAQVQALGQAGVITLVDGLNLGRQLADPDIGPQIRQQLGAADLVLLNKVADEDGALCAQLKSLGARRPVVLDEAPVAEVLLGLMPLPKQRQPILHPAYASWAFQSEATYDRRALGDVLAERPKGLYRLKGFVQTTRGAYELHIVGDSVEAKPCTATKTELVALGPKSQISTEEIAAWWAQVPTV